MSFFKKLYNHLIPDLGDDDYLVRDYVRMSYELGRNINLKIKSPKRLKQEHDNISNLHKKGKLGEIKAKDWYRVIKSTDKYDIELVDDVDRLITEGAMMKHCVTSYSSVINSGQSSIFHITVKDEKLLNRYCEDDNDLHKKGWTLEAGIGLETDGNIHFKMKQFRGYTNIVPPSEVVNDINNLLQNTKVSMLKKEEKVLGLHKPVQQIVYAFEPEDEYKQQRVEPLFNEWNDDFQVVLEEDLPF